MTPRPTRRYQDRCEDRGIYDILKQNKKFEARNPKYETNSNDKNTKFKKRCF